MENNCELPILQRFAAENEIYRVLTLQTYSTPDLHWAEKKTLWEECTKCNSDGPPGYPRNILTSSRRPNSPRTQRKSFIPHPPPTLIITLFSHIITIAWIDYFQAVIYDKQWSRFVLFQFPVFTPSWSGPLEPDLVPSRTSLMVSLSFSLLQKSSLLISLSFYCYYSLLSLFITSPVSNWLLSLFITGLVL